MPLPKELQVRILRRWLEKKGIDPDTVDLEALVDSNLEFAENVKNVERHLGISLKHIGFSEEDAKAYEEYGNNLSLQSHLRDIEEKIEEEEKRHYSEITGRFEELAEKGDPLEYLSKQLFPELVGEQYDFVRKAVLLSLVTHYDKAKRTRIHVLIVGPPGTGKTEILKWISTKLGAAFVNGEYVSKVGLTADARGKNVTPGVLAEYDGHIVCIDEIDKIPPRDQGGLLQAMEEGAYTVVKGKHRTRFRAEVRVIASANDLNKVIPPLRDRFDFIIELKIPSRDERANMVDKIVDEFFGRYNTDSNILHEYINWISGFEPGVEDLETIKKVMREYIKLTNNDIESFSVRSLELSVLRIAYALAKLEKKNVTPLHVVKAIRLKDPTLNNTQYKYLAAIAEKIIDE